MHRKAGIGKGEKSNFTHNPKIKNPPPDRYRKTS